MEIPLDHASDGLTLDQLTIFVTVVEQGSFSAAARYLRRAQSAITYGIQNLELQTGTELFDRSAYRPTLTAAGRVLLPRAQRVVGSVHDYRRQARSLTAGVEARLTLVADVTAPDAIVTAALKAFGAEFPMVELVLLTKAIESSFSALHDGSADLGLIVAPPTFPQLEGLELSTFGHLSLVVVAAPDHPLVASAGPLDESDLRDHTQLMLSTSDANSGGDHSGYGINRWRIHDLHMRHRLLLAGVGWSSMPRHMVMDDILHGRLVKLDLSERAANAFGIAVPLAAARLRSKTLGPAGDWLFRRLVHQGGSLEYL
jgi:DNA-binding transcriptional LysR family regulator